MLSCYFLLSAVRASIAARVFGRWSSLRRILASPARLDTLPVTLAAVEAVTAESKNLLESIVAACDNLESFLDWTYHNGGLPH